MTDSPNVPGGLPGSHRRSAAPFIRYRGNRLQREEHPARPLIWALVWIVVPAYWAGTIYWLVQAVY